MSSLDQLKITFFDECSELLQQTEAGLTDIREGHGTDDTVNAVFRAVHSVKGGAGIFGFKSLVEFAHVFETTLDAVRRGDLAPTPDVADVLLAAGDVLTDLVDMSRSGAAIELGFGSECRVALEQLIGRDGAADDNSPAPADFEDIDFTPVRADELETPGGTDGLRTYLITFRPKPDLLKHANEPLYIVRELRKLGELDFVSETDGLPPLTEVESDRPYIGWTGTLRTEANRAQVDEVFEFVAGDCELIIEEQTPPATESVVEDTPDPEPAAVGAAAAPATPQSDQPAEKSPPVSAAAGETPEPSTGARAPVAKPAATTTRVELERIDRVVNMVGELVIAQAMLEQIVRDLPESISGRLSQILEEVVHHARELKDSVMSMRAQPVGAVFQRMPRRVRELSTKTGKKIRLEMLGETTEVDRSIIERLGDPLTHIMRNAVDHGIELPSDRLAANKSDEGTIRTLSRASRGPHCYRSQR